MFESNRDAPVDCVPAVDELIFHHSPNDSNESSESITNKCGRWSLGNDVNSNPPLLEDMGLSVLSEVGDQEIMSVMNNKESMDDSKADCNNQNLKEKFAEARQDIFEQEHTSTNDFFVFKKRRLDRIGGEDKINCLLDEIMLDIFKWLPKYMLARCAQVCRRWKRLAYSEILWKKLDLGGRVLEPGVVGTIVMRGCNVLRLAKAEISGPMFYPQVQIILPNVFTCRLLYLDLSMAALTAEDLSELLGMCTSLKKLSLEHCTVNYDCCINMARNRNLYTLNLAMCYGLEGEGLNIIFEQCVGLVSINLGWINLSSEDLTIVCESFPPTLCRLNLSGCRKSLTDTHVKMIIKCCPELVELDLSDATLITSVSLRFMIKHAPDLEYLAFARCYGISPDSYLELKNMPCLMYLDIYGILGEPALLALRESLPKIKINKYLFSSVARPTVGIRRTSIWGQRVRD